MNSYNESQLLRQKEPKLHPARDHHHLCEMKCERNQDLNNLHSPHSHQIWAVTLKEDPGVAGGTWPQRGASLEPLP